MDILAMDLGKNNTVICKYDSISGNHSFFKIKTCSQAIHDLLAEARPGRVVFEICSIAGWVYDICSALGLSVEVANPNTQGWRWKNVKNKNDRKDALKLAQLSCMNQLPTVHMPRPAVRQKRALIKYRQTLVKRVVQIKNSIRTILDKQGLVLRSGQGGWTKESVALLKREALCFEECDVLELWRGQLHAELCAYESAQERLGDVTAKLDSLGKSDRDVQLLESAAGVGPRLAEAVAAFIDEPGRFASGKQVGAYAGLTPRQYQSGSMDRQGRISGQGNKLLRSLLVEVSWLGLRYNRWMNETYHRILRGTASRKKIAITAVARKLLVRCWAMLRDGRPWREDVCDACAA